MSRHRCRICLVLLQGSDYIFIHPIKGGVGVLTMSLLMIPSLCLFGYSPHKRDKSLQGYMNNHNVTCAALHFIWSDRFLIHKLPTVLPLRCSCVRVSPL